MIWHYLSCSHGLKELTPLIVSKDFVHGYKELGHEKVGKRQAIKMELRFRPGRMPVEQCLLWIDEKSHAPLRAEPGPIGKGMNLHNREL